MRLKVLMLRLLFAYTTEEAELFLAGFIPSSKLQYVEADL